MTTATEPDKTDTKVEEEKVREQLRDASRKDAAAALDAIDSRSRPDFLSKPEKSEKVEGAAATPKTEAVEKPAEVEEVVDLSNVPDALREEFRKLSAGAQKWTSKSTLRRTNYDALKREADEALAKSKTDTEDAARWRKLMASPEKARAVLDALEGNASPAAAKGLSDFVDPDVEAAIKQAVEREVKRLVPQIAEERARSVLDSEVRQPLSRAQAVNSALNAFAEEEGFDEASMRAGIAAANAYNESNGGPVFLASGVTLDPAAAVSWLRPFLPAKVEARVAAQGNGSAGNAPAKSAGVAAPRGGGGGEVTPPTLPRHVREGRRAETREERLEELAAHMNRANPGLNVTVERLKAEGY